MPTHREFELAAGSTIGRDHREVPKNCQDSFVLVRDDLCSAGIVADGCGSGAHSEVGAQLGARLLAHSITSEVRLRRSSQDINWQRIRQDLLSQLHVLARGMGGDFRETVNEYFLFTVVGVLLAYDTATFFAIGDGVIMVNGESYQLGPFANNQPPYVGYGLLPGNVEMDAEELQFQILDECPLKSVDTFLVGSDGVLDLMRVSQKNLPGLSQPVGGIEQFWTEDRFFGNQQLVSRQLKLVGRDWPKRDPHPGLLPDDTTLLVGRRKPSDS
jgi:hypothetical protein